MPCRAVAALLTPLILLLLVPARPASARPATGPASYADVVAKVLPSVVNVSTEKRIATRGSPWGGPLLGPPFGMLRGPGRRARSLGSGVIMSPDGVILTNRHVVEGATRIVVTLGDKRMLPAKVLGSDPKTDIAVLKIEASGLPAIEIADSDAIRVGDVVLAIGNPFGVGQTVTMGIVSALGRNNVHITDYEDFIQTDASINPGNSGGALVTADGKLAGINTAILSRSGGSQGIGFAIPANMATALMKAILDHGRVVRGYLGVYLQDLDAEIAKALDLDGVRGALVVQVERGSPADRAGLAREDVVVKLDGRPVPNVPSLRNRIALTSPGSTISLDILRGGRRRKVRVKLGVLGGPPATQGAETADADTPLGGVSVVSLTSRQIRRLGLREDTEGVLVTSVADRTPAARSGLRPDDVILEVNRQGVPNPRVFRRVARRLKQHALLLVVRDGQTFYLVVRAQG